MLDRLLDFSLRQRGLIVLVTLALAGLGLWSAARLPIDAMPDITPVQVQVNTAVQSLAPEEIEQLVTFPIESEMAGLPGMVEMRSLSKFGLSQLTLIFADGTDSFRVRQLAAERLQNAQEKLPRGLQPKLAPISTGLGEIFYYSLAYKKDAKHKPATPFERLLELSQIQQYTVKLLLRSTPGLAEVNTSGGYEKQVVVRPDPRRLAAAGMTAADLAEKLRASAENAGGGLTEIGGEQIVIRADTRARTLEQISALPLKFGAGVTPLLVKDVAEVGIGSSFRTGASTEDGEEAIVGGAMMLAGENSRLVARSVAARLAEINTKLPEGVEVRPLYDRSDLVNATIRTVEKNLFEGALLVVVVLFALLGNWRAAIIVALAIPLSMLMAVTGMVESRISGNLMSLGAVDFGLIIDGAVVMVENIIRHLAHRQAQLGRRLTAAERTQEVLASAKEVASPMFFGVLIITVVYVPILALTGIEGKLFRPMALTVMFALGAALVLSLTLMPVLCSFFLGGNIREKDNALVTFFKNLYTPLLRFALRWRWPTVGAAVGLFALSLWVFARLGAEFIPQLDEGAISVQMIRGTSVGLSASLDLQQKSERFLQERFPEITHLFSRIGTSEIAVDPMGPNISDTYVFFRPRETWRKANGKTVTKAQLIALMQEELEASVPGQAYLFSQPIQLRFNEIMAGARADLVVKIFGPDFAQLDDLANQVRDVLAAIPGGGDVEFDAGGRVPMLEITSRRDALSRLNLHADEINKVVAGSLAGEEVGALVEGNRRSEIVVRLDESLRSDPAAMEQLPLRAENNGILPLGRVAEMKMVERVGFINREAGQRRAAILVNLRGRDTEGFVREAEAQIRKKVQFPDGCFFEFGGQFKNLQEARARLAIVVPAALALIFVLIFASFGNARQAALIFVCVPLAVTGGIFALWVRGMPFTISAGIGFIALSGIAVLNGIMLISFINQLRARGAALRDAVVEGTLTRLRPKLMTALVASLGFVPMALGSGAGAEVQRPLATVVIGGIVTSTFLTLIVLPILYDWIEARHERRAAGSRPPSRPDSAARTTRAVDAPETLLAGTP